MPFQSQAQRGYMYANKPELAKEFEGKTPKGKKLPKHKKKSDYQMSAMKKKIEKK